MRFPRPSLIVFGVLLLAVVTSAHSHSSQSQTASTVPGNEACASCHAGIYNTYSKTVMARASGRAGDGLITGQFLHKPSGVRYRVYTQDGQVWMSYERQSEKDFHGQRELLYFIGSGVKGRTYLFSTDGFLFEAPINWYSQEGKWNMTPAYTEAQNIPMNLPAYPSCLNCHTSGMQAPEPGTDSKFSGEPFAHSGITCERCHGAGNGHIEGKGAIVNPAKLTSERRDAICMECHFEGTAAVEQPGKHLYDFEPGERLSDYEHYFLLSGNEPRTAQALSQFEALSLSACKRQSGDRMWCGSCHDPHAEPSASEKAAYYRGKCLKCHGEAFAARHHADKPDCTSCHMPALPSKDVAHTEGTDHRILSYPTAQVLPRLKLRGVPLVAFPESDAGLATTRDFALAWQTLAERGVDGAGQRAAEYLQKAVKERPDDPDVLSALAFVEQENGRQNEARELYEQALKADPLNNEAATNLGLLEARAGNLRRAVELWQRAFARAPHRSAIGINLAIAFCAAGQRDDARKYVERVLEFNPDYSKAKSLVKKMDAGECRP
ncbi:MAG: tetratricopeptide repeat protein [Candidatus Sulfotelmatobacter sp.]